MRSGSPRATTDRSHGERQSRELLRARFAFKIGGEGLPRQHGAARREHPKRYGDVGTGRSGGAAVEVRAHQAPTQKKISRE